MTGCVLINQTLNCFHPGCVHRRQSACVFASPRLSHESSEQVLACSALGKLWAEQIAGSVFLAAATLVSVRAMCMHCEHLYSRFSIVDSRGVVSAWSMFAYGIMQSRDDRTFSGRDELHSQARQKMTPLLFPHLCCLAAFSRLDLRNHRQTQLRMCTQWTNHTLMQTHQR